MMGVGTLRGVDLDPRKARGTPGNKVESSGLYLVERSIGILRLSSGRGLEASERARLVWRERRLARHHVLLAFRPPAFPWTAPGADDTTFCLPLVR